jgi:hypothetical protein
MQMELEVGHIGRELGKVDGAVELVVLKIQARQGCGQPCEVDSAAELVGAQIEE